MPPFPIPIDPAILHLRVGDTGMVSKRIEAGAAVGVSFTR